MSSSTPTSTTASLSGSSKAVSTTAAAAQFVSIASAPPLKTTAAAAAAGSAPSNPPASPSIPVVTSTPFTGAINLTITNGSINLKPGSQPQMVPASMQGTLKTNIGNSGSLQKIPIVPQNIPANLVRGQTLNVRIAAPMPRPATLMAPRTMVIGSAQLRGQNSFVLGSGTLILPTNAKVSPGQAITAQIGGANIPGKVPVRATLNKPLPGKTIGLSTSGITSTASLSVASPMTFTTMPVSSLPLATQQQLQQQNPQMPQSVLVANTTSCGNKMMGSTITQGSMITMMSGPIMTVADKKISEVPKPVDKRPTEKKAASKKRKASQEEKEKKEKKDEKQVKKVSQEKVTAEKQDTSIKEKTMVVTTPKKSSAGEKTEDKKTAPKLKKILPAPDKKKETNFASAQNTPTKDAGSLKVISTSQTPEKSQVKVITPVLTPVSTPIKTPLKTPDKLEQKEEGKAKVEEGQSSDTTKLGATKETPTKPPTVMKDTAKPTAITDTTDKPVAVVKEAAKPIAAKEEEKKKEEKTSEPKEKGVEEIMAGNSAEDPVMECLGADPDTDFSDTLDWHNGIGTLPGSDMKFRKNEFGVLEMIMDNIENLLCTENMPIPAEMMDTTEEEKNPPSLPPPHSSPSPTQLVKEETKDEEKEEKMDTEEKREEKEEKNIKEKKKTDVEGMRNSSLMEALGGCSSEDRKASVRCCENCGNYGLPTEFLLEGKFCGRSCVSAYATKKGLGKKGMKVSPPKLPEPSNDTSSSSASTSSQSSTSSTSSNPSTMTNNKSDEQKRKRKRKMSKSPTDQLEAKHPKLDPDVKVKEEVKVESRSPSDEENDEINDAASTGSTESQRLKAGGMTAGVTSSGRKARGWTWNNYLEKEKACRMPIKVFKEFQQVPSQKNGFKVGMKVEGIDPLHPSLYCVMTVTEVKGFRLRLHFDGYSECHDFWVNANSPFIFPPGFAEKNGKQIQPPKGQEEPFNWSAYLKATKSPAAPKNLFTSTSVFPMTPHGFRLGMKLEAVDKKNTALTCVATIVDVLGDRLLIHFDGWEDIYDYWSEPTSPYIHPVGWCQETGKPLSPPNDWPDIKGFTWEKYLDHTKSQCAPARAFKTRPPPNCEPGMKLEVVDKRNPVLIRVATVVDLDGHAIKIHYDGWSSHYDLCVDDDDFDIHPVGWCGRTGHPLQAPPGEKSGAYNSSDSGCPTPGCTGVGHIKGAKYAGHHSHYGCPYSPMNLNREDVIPDRLGNSVARRQQEPDGKSTYDASEDPTGEEKGICPTPGCNGAGHITGRWTTHYKQSGCPLAEANKEKLSTDPSLAEHLRQLNHGRPLIGPGSGRGRKNKKVLQLLKQEQEQKGGTENGGNITPTQPTPTNSLHQRIHESVFMAALLPGNPSAIPLPTPPSRDLPLNWQLHSKLLPAVISEKAPKDVAKWTKEQVGQFVSEVPGCENLGQRFIDELVDGEAFLLLQQEDIIKQLSIKMGPALKIINSVLVIKNYEGETAAE